MKKLLLLIGMLLTVTTAFADGNELLKSCNAALKDHSSVPSFESGLDAGFCLGFVQGVRQLNLMYQHSRERKVNRPFFCLPEDGIKNIQAIRIVTKFLSEHPEKLHEPEIALVIIAFIEAFPCTQ